MEPLVKFGFLPSRRVRRRSHEKRQRGVEAARQYGAVLANGLEAFLLVPGDLREPHLHRFLF